MLLVHGLVDNRSVFTVMRRSLRRRGFAQVCSWNYSPLLTDVSRGAADLGEHIERMCQQTGHERVHVVGHSLGGLIARYHVQRQGGDRRVESLVTLGTPHQGSLWAHVLPTPLVRQLKPGSTLLQELAEPATTCTTRITAIYSDLDEIVVPTRAGRCDHADLGARNVLVRGVGHMSLPMHRGVADEVAATLAGLRPATGPPPPPSPEKGRPSAFLPRPRPRPGPEAVPAATSRHVAFGRWHAPYGSLRFDHGAGGHRWTPGPGALSRPSLHPTDRLPRARPVVPAGRCPECSPVATPRSPSGPRPAASPRRRPPLPSGPGAACRSRRASVPTSGSAR